MWFKNLCLYRLSDPFEHSPEELATAMQAYASRPCGSLEPFTYGWTPPLGNMGTELVHAANGCILICAVMEERLLPASVVRETVEERIAAIEEIEGRRVRGKERRNMRDDVTFELLPKAFTRKNYTHAYLSPDEHWLVVDTPTPKKAEELLVMLAHSLGELKVEAFKSDVSATALMTRWMSGRDVPADFAVLQDCELRDPADDKSIIRCQRQDLAADEIQMHLRAHKQVHKLALGFDERLSFILRSDLTLTRLRFESVEELDYNDGVDEIGRFDANFAFMSSELKLLLDRLTDVFEPPSEKGAAA